MTTLLRFAACVAVLAAVTGTPTAQQPQAKWEGKLAPVPVDWITAPTTTGSGTAVAVLTGSQLKITGKFEGMNSPATMAHVHVGRGGVRGPIVFHLKFTGGRAGTFEGTFALTMDQIAELTRGHYYVQIHTEKAPEGQLRAWLMK